MTRIAHVAWFSLIGLVALLLAVASLVWLGQVQHQRDLDQVKIAHDLCERSVDARSDNRAMWLWTFDRFKGGPNVADARVELDKRLPVLVCRNNIPLPKETL